MQVRVLLVSVLSILGVALLNGCGGSSSASVTRLIPGVTVKATTQTITVVQSLQVTVTVTGSDGTPTGSIVLSSGSYSATSTLSSGVASFTVAAGSLAVGSNTFTASFTPDTSSSGTYASASGTSSAVTVSKLTPVVTVTPAASLITPSTALSVSVQVSGTDGTPTGTVVLAGGSFTSSATTLSSGSATISVTGGNLSYGVDTLTATYTPDTTSASLYLANTGTGSVSVPSSVSVDQSTYGNAVTDQILGMNMATWYDVDTNKAAIVSAFQNTGIKAVRWPGGSWSDIYHWSTNSNCFSDTDGSPGSKDTFANFVSDIVTPAGLDLALTANYGTDAACTGGGDPSEAAAWVTEANALGVNVSHMTVGNEVYGSTWETDKHTSPNDPTTYAAAVSGSSGYYAQIKAANSSTKVGIVLDADGTSTGWDATVLANAKGYYDFVEYHYYPQAPFYESDSKLLHSGSYDAQSLTKNLKILTKEMSVYGNSVPIYMGELGSVYTTPGKQSMSITQALFAGEVLGEMMNYGIARATWWIGFGGCETDGNLSSSLYGWQTYGGYMVFSDGTCSAAPTVGTPTPTARAFQLFSHVAVDGEYVLTPTVSGDTTNVVAYAATHNAKTATALVLFNLNQTVSEPVTISLSGSSASSDVVEYSYTKALYDETDATTPVWAAPTTTDLGAQSLPMTVTLDPWSMNVFLIN